MGRLTPTLLVLTLALPATAQSSRTALLRVTQGKSASTALRGDAFSKLTGARVLTAGARPRPAEGLEVALGRSVRGSRTLTVTASATAQLSEGLIVQGLIGRRVAMVLPVRVDVLPAAQRREPQREAALEGKALELLMQPGTRRVVELRGAAYRSYVAARQAPSNLRARLEVKMTRTRLGLQLAIGVPKGASVGSRYSLQGQSNRRWPELPVRIAVRATIMDAKDAIVGGRAVRAMPPGGVHRGPGGVVMVIGESKHWAAKDPYDGPIVTSWSPEESGDIGGRLKVFGERMPDDVIVKLGDATLAGVSRNSNMIEVKLPSAAWSPSELRVVSPGTGWQRKLVDRFSVEVAPAFRQMDCDASQHRAINAYLMGYLSLKVYLSEWGTKRESRFQAKIKTSLLAQGFETVRTISLQAPGVDTQLLIAANDDVIVICFRGTELMDGAVKALKDSLSDINLGIVPINHWYSGAAIHGGFHLALNRAWPSIVTQLKALRDNGQPVALTGHSLGGALATLCAYRMRKDAGLKLKATMVYTFGSPRVGNAKWREAYAAAGLQARTFRYDNDNDPIPTFPPTALNKAWTHVGATYNINSAGTIIANAPPKSGLAADLGDHSMQSYLAALRGALTQQQRALVPNYK